MISRPIAFVINSYDHDLCYCCSLREFACLTNYRHPGSSAHGVGSARRVCYVASASAADSGSKFQIDVYGMRVCAEGPLFGAKSMFLVEGNFAKKSPKYPLWYANFREKRGPLRPDTIVFEIFMWSTVEEYAILAPKRLPGLPETPGFLKTAFVASGYHRL